MTNYNNKGGDRGRGGNRGGFGGGDRGRSKDGRGRGGDRGGNRSFGAPSMHKATCDSCGKMAEVPFKPTGDKPVLCSECFGAKRGGDSRARNDKRDFKGGDRRNDRDRRPGTDMSGVLQKVDALHAKMDKIIAHLGIQKDIAEKPKEYESSTVFRAAPAPTLPKKPKEKGVKEGDLKKAIATAVVPKESLSKAKKVAKKSAPKKAVKKVTKKATKKVSKKAAKKKK